MKILNLFKFHGAQLSLKLAKERPTVFDSNPGAHNGSPMHGATAIFVNDDAAKQPWSC